MTDDSSPSLPTPSTADAPAPAPSAAPTAAPSSAMTTRRGFLRRAARAIALLFGGGLVGSLWGRRALGASSWTWQIDPERCQGAPGQPGCEACADRCVLTPSAVKCFHRAEMCGYCERCFGYFRTDMIDADEGAENQLCPTGAIRRRLVEAPYYEYDIDQARCVGCGRCVKGCQTSGNASLFLQIHQSACERCNVCALERACPYGAVRRVPATPATGGYTPRRRHGEA